MHNWAGLQKHHEKKAILKTFQVKIFRTEELLQKLSKMTDWSLHQKVFYRISVKYDVQIRDGV